jgi:ADP-heptose:LPS heptosyltransferase
MSTGDIVRTDCRWHRPARPCDPHKAHGVTCGACTFHEPVRTRILIVKLDALGDVLRTTSCLPVLRERYPAAHITWFTASSAVALLQHNPWIDRVLPADGSHVEVLLTERFDLAICPDADDRSARLMTLAVASEKRGFVADSVGRVQPLDDVARAWWMLGLDDQRKRANRRSYGTWLLDLCGLSGPVRPPVLTVRDHVQSEARRALRAIGDADTRWVGFNTGASTRWAEKAWKPTHFSALAELVVAHAPNARVALLGGPAQRPLHRALARSHPAFANLGNSLSPEQFAARVACCEWLLTSDSLGYHVACATGTPAACVVGPTAPWELDTFSRNLVLHADRPCIGCYRSVCPLPSTCMDELDAQAVWARVRPWWSAQSASAERPAHPVPMGDRAVAIGTSC